jgi:hypothetical protein
MGRPRLMKVDDDFYKEIKFITTSKRNRLIPTTMVGETKEISKLLRRNRQR